MKLKTILARFETARKTPNSGTDHDAYATVYFNHKWIYNGKEYSRRQEVYTPQRFLECDAKIIKRFNLESIPFLLSDFSVARNPKPHITHGCLIIELTNDDQANEIYRIACEEYRQKCLAESKSQQ